MENVEFLPGCLFMLLNMFVSRSAINFNAGVKTPAAGMLAG